LRIIGVFSFDINAAMTRANSLIEKVFFWGSLSPYVLYFIGLGPIAPLLLAWPLIVLAFFTWLRDGIRPPLLAVVWCLSCTGILVEELLSLYMHGLGFKHIPWWFLTYALGAFLPLVGGLIRPAVIGSAATLLGVQTLIYCLIAFVLTAAQVLPLIEYKALIPSSLFGNKDLFSVHFLAPAYRIDQEWRLVAFTPYAPFAGAMAIMFLILTLVVKNSLVKWIGVTGWVLLLICTYSRMGMLASVTIIMIYVIVGYGRRYFFLASGAGMLAVAALAGPLLNFSEKAASAVHSARLNSSQDRENLRAIAFENWLYGDHAVLGAGETVPGSQIVNQVYIGDLDSLGAMLFLRGAVGFCFTVAPILFTWVFGMSAGTHPYHRAVLCIAMALMFYSYSQSLKDLFMYFWPIFLFIGAVAFRDRDRVFASEFQPAFCTT